MTGACTTGNPSNPKSTRRPQCAHGRRSVSRRSPSSSLHSRRRDRHHPSRRPACTLRRRLPKSTRWWSDQLPGTAAWRIPWAGRTVADDRTLAIKGYAAAASLEKGQSVGIRVHAASAGPASYGVYRLGGYQGLGGRQMTSGTFTAVRQPACTTEMPIGLILPVERLLHGADRGRLDERRVRRRPHPRDRAVLCLLRGPRRPQDRRARAPAADAHEPGVQQLPEQRDDAGKSLYAYPRSARSP